MACCATLIKPLNTARRFVADDSFVQLSVRYKTPYCVPARYEYHTPSVFTGIAGSLIRTVLFSPLSCVLVLCRNTAPPSGKLWLNAGHHQPATNRYEQSGDERVFKRQLDMLQMGVRCDVDSEPCAGGSDEHH